MASILRKFVNKLPVVWSLILIVVGLFVYRGFLQDNYLPSIILISGSTLSMIAILGIWRRFVSNYADEIIHWTSEKVFFRKLVAGGSFSYYEYNEHPDQIGLFEPISRFINLLIAFIGISTSLANIANLEPNSPTADLYSALVWTALIFLVPILLTPIIPIIWAMEDLQLKSWNAKFKTNVRISRRYKARFNSFIAISTLGAAFGLSRNPQLDFVDQLVNFVNLLISGVFVLTYPIAVLTTLYYLYFRGKMVDKIRDKLDLPIAETKLIFIDNEGGELSDASELDTGVVQEVMTGSINDEEQEISDIEGRSIPQKLGDGTKRIVSKTGEVITNTGKGIIGGVKSIGRTVSNNTVGRISPMKKERPDNQDKISGETEPKKKKKRGGSATEGLWDKDY